MDLLLHITKDISETLLPLPWKSTTKKNNKLQKSGFFLSPICLNATKIKPDLDIIQ